MGDPGAPFAGRPPLPFLTRTTMTPLPLRRGAAFLHRWAALVFAPLFLVILLSGAFLACKPLWEAWQADQPQPGLTPQAWIQALETLDSRGQAGNAILSPDGQRLMLQGRSPESRKTYDVRTLAPLPNQDRDWFEVAKGLHKTLLLQADPLVEAATYVLTALLALGLLLGWPRLKPQLRQWGWMDWHQGLGWLLAPLVLLTPVTAILMILHIGTGPAKAEPVCDTVQKKVSVMLCFQATGVMTVVLAALLTQAIIVGMRSLSARMRTKMSTNPIIAFLSAPLAFSRSCGSSALANFTPRMTQ